jgi:Bacterial Ig domain
LQPTAITLTGYDANGETLIFALATSPSQGTISQFDQTMGKLIYSPGPGFSVSDSFSFLVSDGIAKSDPVSVTILPPLDFSFAAANGSSLSATVAAGQTATYSLQAMPTGFVGNVSLQCSGAPLASTCTVAPVAIELSSIPVTFTVNVTTASAVSSSVITSKIFLSSWIPFFGLLCFVALLKFLTKPRSRRIIIGFATCLIVFCLTSCGGGNNASGTTTQGPPSGSYSLMVSGISGNLTRTVTLTLTVK